MTSKSFKSAFSPDKVLRITGSPERICLAQRYRNDTESLVFIDSSAVPALALAILEAAGYAKPFTPEISELNDYALGAVQSLRKSVALQERATAEARERAELESEALELHNAFWAGLEEKQLDSWDDERGNAKNSWVSAARRAREMRTEK